MSISASEAGCSHRTLLEALLGAPDGREFVTMWHDDDDWESITFGEFKRRAAGEAARLAAHGIVRGDTVVLVMPQGIALMAAFAGAMLSGAVPAILAYPHFKVDPAKYRAGLAGVTRNLRARLVLVDRDFPEELVQYIDNGEGARLQRAGSAAPVNPASHFAPVAPGDLAFIQHSAGTTGLQKGVALSHRAVLHQLQLLADAIRLDRDDRIYSWLPLYHDMGLIACFMLPMVHHIPVVLQAPDEWVISPGSMLQLIGAHRCTVAWVPNFTLQFLARRVCADDRAGFDLSSLRAMINCSEPVRARSIDEFAHAYAPCGLRRTALQASYAMAENVFAITQSDPEREPVRVSVDRALLREQAIVQPVPGCDPRALWLVSSGRCLPGTEVRVVSPGGEECGEARVGELAIRSGSLFDGYYNRSDLTEKVLKDGWYYTGDVGFVLDGEVFVTGRKKDLIIVAGKNIHPEDLEEIACRHPAIRGGRAVAFGLYDETLGTEEIVIIAELAAGADRTTREIERALRAAIAAELGVAPRTILFKPERWIVKSTAGKASRSATRDKFLAEIASTPKTNGKHAVHD